MLEGHEPDGDTQYRIGSLTKTFIAVLVMRLRDEGRLDLADPLGKYLDVGQVGERDDRPVAPAHRGPGLRRSWSCGGSAVPVTCGQP